MTAKLKKVFLRDLLTSFLWVYHELMFKKFILFFILLLIFLSLSSFFLNAYNMQKIYFSNKISNETSTEDIQEGKGKDNETPSTYSMYSKDQYDKALSEHRIVLLFFTSNWCNDCISQSATNKAAFNELSLRGVVGLETHILDSETTVELDALAKKFDVKKENSFIVLDRSGAVVYRYVGVLEKDLLKSKILEVGDLE